MEVLLSFIIKNIDDHTDQRYQKDYPEDMLFIDVLRDILEVLDSNITLDKIAVISAIKGLFSYDEVHKTVKEIVAMHLLEFTITKRDLVDGPNLLLKEQITKIGEEISSNEMEFGYLKSKVESEALPQLEQIPKPQLEAILDLKPLESEIAKEKADDFGTKSGKRDEMDDAKEAIDKMEEMLRKPSEEDKTLHLPKTAPPPPDSAPMGPPKSPPNRNRGVTKELKKVFSETLKKKSIKPPAGPPASRSAAPPPASVKRRAPMEDSAKDSSPLPPPSPAPSVPRAKAGSMFFSSKEKKKGKKAAAKIMSYADKADDSALILDETPKEMGIAGDLGGIIEEKEEKREVEDLDILEETEEMEEEVEMSTMDDLASLTSDPFPALTEIANEIETSKEYKKNIAIEYFDKMNPKKYYPLIIDITDIEQATKISEENIITGERKVQVKEKMAVVLKSSIVKVKPMFPGCSIVPEERYTDLDKKEDKLTFYVTPLVDDEIEAGRIEFIDSEGNIFHSASTPTKVEDPRFARVIALYGGIASFLPKILETLGFSFTADTQMATLLPFLQNLLGDMNLSNFIGISGILITTIICIITMAVRKPNSVKKKFKVDRVGSLKSAAKVQK